MLVRRRVLYRSFCDVACACAGHVHAPCSLAVCLCVRGPGVHVKEHRERGLSVSLARRHRQDCRVRVKLSLTLTSLTRDARYLCNLLGKTCGTSRTERYTYGASMCVCHVNDHCDVHGPTSIRAYDAAVSSSQGHPPHLVPYRRGQARAPQPLDVR